MSQTSRWIIWMCLLILLLAGVSRAQSPEAGKPSADPPSLGLYNPQTVETVKGIVVAPAKAVSLEGLPQPDRLTLKTDRGNIVVIMGPGWFIDRQEMKLPPWIRLRSPAPGSCCRVSRPSWLPRSGKAIRC